jgi:hypothetical protein
MATYEITDDATGKTYEIGGVDSQQAAYEMFSKSRGAAPAAPAGPTMQEAEPSFVQKVGSTFNRAWQGAPRQIGLAARYALEGPAETAQIVTEPVRYLTDRLTGMTGQTRPLGKQAEHFADAIGLPKPETPTERVVGDATRLGFGAMAPGKAAEFGAGLIDNTAPLVKKALTSMAANPGTQVAGAVGAGGLGGSVREAGGTPLAQAGGALVGGVLGSGLPAALKGGYNAVAPTIGRMIGGGDKQTQQLDLQISNVLRQSGTNWADLSARTQASLRDELASALRTGQELDPAAVSRLAAFREVGVQPTRGMLSQDPVQITREQYLAMTAANSANGELHGLPRLQNQNNTALIGRMNDLGNGSNTRPIQAGRLVVDNVTGTRDALRSIEQGAWQHAKGSPGYTAAISNEPVHAAFRAVDEEGLISFLPKQVTDRMEAFMNGATFTPQEYRNLRSVLSNVADPSNTDGNARAAAGFAARALDSAQMKPIESHLASGGLPVTGGTAAAMRTADNVGTSAIDAVDRARRATRSAYGYEDSNALVRSVLADARSADPEKIAQSFIMGGTVNDARQVAQAVGPQGRETIKNALMTHIKKAALGNASDETGKVSQKALRDALENIGDEKLALFFSPQELGQLRNTSRVASLMQSQPIGSAVNNSNSGALLLGRGIDLLDHVPVVGPMVAPALQNIGASYRTAQAQRVMPGLLAKQATPAGSGLLLPGAAIGGALAPTIPIGQ